MLPDQQVSINAAELEQAAAKQREKLAALGNEERSRRAKALDHMLEYAAMLRESVRAHAGSESLSVACCFKVEFEDGRWSIEEKELGAAPHVGDVVSLEGGRAWCVTATQFVRPRPSGKPARELFVCAPVAA